MVLIAVGGEAFEVVLEEEEAEEGRVAALHGDVPGEHHDEVEQDAGDPDGAAQQRPLAAERGEEKNDAKGEKRGDGAFGKRGGGAEKVEIEEPELATGLIPGVPAEHADRERRGELHVG